MKKGKLWSISPIVAAFAVALLVLTAITFFLDTTHLVFIAEVVLDLMLIGFAVFRFAKLKSDISRYLVRVADSLNQEDHVSLSRSPLPVAVGSLTGEVIWYNLLFRRQVLGDEELFGDPLEIILGGTPVRDVQHKKCLDVTYRGKAYTVFVSPLKVKDDTLLVLYYVENTQLKTIAREYADSRPAIMLIYIDNIDEIMQNIRESERAQITGKVETLLEDWIGATTGVMRKYESDRFLVVLEQRYLQKMIDKKFDVLDRVRQIQTSDHINVTLSIGIGQGENFKASEELARQAIEMALGRGGDQVAVKTANGFDFYGGMSKGIEKRTKVRTRVVASAILDLVSNSDNVLIMGHRFSDLDCLGSAAALAVMARSKGKAAYVVVQKSKTLAHELISRYDAAGKGDLFIEPQQAMPMMHKHTLLIVTDTHSPLMLEWPELYEAAESIVVIDHHRKMVNHIENAVVFYHESYASSASEMVAELVQYMGNAVITRLEAEALLAGIMLDTRNFVMKAGVRTFEAAAFLRRLGADTVEVKRMFSESESTYRAKADIVMAAEIHDGAAIACAVNPGPDIRIAASQAADDLLSIKGVRASFTLFCENDIVNISARSLGDFNVQLVMEAMGGGGHLTMAATQLKNISLEEAKATLVKAIDNQMAAYRHAAQAPKETEIK